MWREGSSREGTVAQQEAAGWKEGRAPRHQLLARPSSRPVTFSSSTTAGLFSSSPASQQPRTALLRDEGDHR